jgi:hypothetical protein
MFHRFAILLCAISVALPHVSDAQNMSADNRPWATGEHNVVLNAIRLYYRVAGKPISDRTPTTPTIFLYVVPDTTVTASPRSPEPAWSHISRWST